MQDAPRQERAEVLDPDLFPPSCGPGLLASPSLYVGALLSILAWAGLLALFRVVA